MAVWLRETRGWLARLRTNMAEILVSAVVCPCTDEKQFRQLDSFSYARTCEFELRDVERLIFLPVSLIDLIAVVGSSV